MAKPAASPEIEVREQEQLIPLYHVVLLDDDEHTYDYVIEMLQRLLMMSQVEAFQHAVEVDTAGRTESVSTGTVTMWCRITGTRTCLCSRRGWRTRR